MSISTEARIDPVLAHYPAACQPFQAAFLGNAGGFSGALFWRLTTRQGRLCLRRWPAEHPQRERLEFIQAVLWHVVQEGFDLVPLPLETSEHAGYVEHEGHFWQLEPWVEGRADYAGAPSEERLAAALEALARFHLAAESFPLPDPCPSPSPGIQTRLSQLRSLLDGGLEQIRSSTVRSSWGALRTRSEALVSRFLKCAPAVLRDLDAASRLEVRLQPCIRDIWQDHVFFHGQTVTGFVDFGAMRAENVAGDVARLLGSMAGDRRPDWRLGLAAYHEVRPLSCAELQMVQAFDRSTVLMSGTNWLRWVLLEGREFENRETVLARVDANLTRLLHLAEMPS